MGIDIIYMIYICIVYIIYVYKFTYICIFRSEILTQQYYINWFGLVIAIKVHNWGLCKYVIWLKKQIPHFIFSIQSKLIKVSFWSRFIILNKPLCSSIIASSCNPTKIYVKAFELYLLRYIGIPEQKKYFGRGLPTKFVTKPLIVAKPLLCNDAVTRMVLLV